ncbi:MAG TPA: carboxypeptidase-like regulatory domain-containing protein [Blastocatellia bacterium]|nr:carboxypeptidase-like regulatory domain-containing protein [Blastocatellia bacterium]
MHTRVRAMVAFIVLFLVAVAAAAQSGARDAKSEKEPTAAITGRVTLKGKAAAGVTVTLLPAEPVMQRGLSVKTTADEDGRYRFTSVAAGRYTVSPLAPALVVPQEANSFYSGKVITVSDGEEVEGVDFSLVRGGVITGRVTDDKGRPAIEQYVDLLQVDERGQKVGNQRYNPFGFSTDDRGVYRAYGLSEGRYLVSVGEGREDGSVRIGIGSGFYEQTFHPNATDQSRAAIVEVKEGMETTGIDVVLASASKSYRATGRIVDADTGKPVANVQFGHGALMKNNQMGATGWTGNRTNAAGEFRIEGLMPGRYAAFMVTEAESDTYSEPAPFEVINEDVKGIEIKVRRGSSISGIAVVEGAQDAEVLARLSSLQLFASGSRGGALVSPRFMPTRIAADGSFHVTGLRPGKIMLRLAGMPNERKGFSVLRVERDGSEQREGIEVGAGEQVTNVRLVLAYGSSVIRGLVKVEGGEMPENLMMRVHALRPGDQTYPVSPVFVDARRRFLLEGLSAGEYDVELLVMSQDRTDPPPKIQPVKQRVIVPASGTVDITLTVNLAARDKDN